MAFHAYMLLCNHELTQLVSFSTAANCESSLPVRYCMETSGLASLASAGREAVSGQISSLFDTDPVQQHLAGNRIVCGLD